MPSGGLDYAVALITDRHKLSAGLTAAGIGGERVAVVAARSSEAGRSAARRLRLRDLAEDAWILSPPACGYRAALQRVFDRQKVTLQIAAEVPGYDLQLSLIARGLGRGLVPGRRLAASPWRRHLRLVAVSDFALDGRIAMVQGGAPGSLQAAVTHFQEGVAAALLNH